MTSINARILVKDELFMDDLDGMNDKLPLQMVDIGNENLSQHNRR